MIEKLPIEKHVGATEVRNKLGRFLNQVHQGEENLVVEKLGIPVAAVISIEDYKRYRQLLAEAILRNLGRNLGEEIKRQELTQEQLLEMMEEDRAEVYERMYGQKD